MDPTPEEIERAWIRERPAPGPEIRAFGRFIRRSTRLSAYAIVGVSLCISVAALADRVGGLGWGYRWADVWVGLGLALFVGVFGFGLEAWFAFIGFEGKARSATSSPSDRDR